MESSIRRIALPLVAAVAVISVSARAQQPSTVGVPSEVHGRVVKPGDTSMVNVKGALVTLHRVGTDRAGPLDSMLTRADGSYDFHYTPSGNADAVYFVSASFDGIAYFSSPLTKQNVSGEDAEIAVFDTTSSIPKLRVRGRHLVVAAPGADGRRMIVEVYELSNDTTKTYVAAGSRPVWTTGIPKNAENFRVGQSDVAAEALLARKGRAELFAPFSPGVKQLSMSYSLPADAFPFEVSLPGPVDVMEVLLEEPGAAVRGDNLVDQGPVQVQGRSFHRFLGQDLNKNTIRVLVPESQHSPWPKVLTAVVSIVGVLLLGALLFVTSRKRRPVRVVAQPDRERIAAEIVALDEAMEHRASPTDEEREAYTLRRDELKRQLATALADSDRTR